jgi:transposase
MAGNFGICADLGLSQNGTGYRWLQASPLSKSLSLLFCSPQGRKSQTVTRCFINNARQPALSPICLPGRAAWRGGARGPAKHHPHAAAPRNAGTWTRSRLPGSSCARAGYRTEYLWTQPRKARDAPRRSMSLFQAKVFMSTHMLGARSFQFVEVRPYRLDASPASARRRLSAAPKGRMVREAMAPDANVSSIARGDGMSPAQLFGWRRQALKHLVELGGSSATDAAPAPIIEIGVSSATIRVGADIGEEQLRRVIRTVRSA